MNEKIPDAGEDDDILMTRMFAGERAADTGKFEKFAEPFAEIENEADLLEIPESPTAAPIVSDAEEYAAEPTSLDPLLELPVDDFDQPETEFQTANDAPPLDENAPAENFEFAKEQQDAPAAPIFQSAYQPESSAETIRKSGLAYTAAIVLFGSIIFALIIGWFADLLFGTSPWGKVGGIVLGSIIGFIQFFRATSQILKNKD